MWNKRGISKVGAGRDLTLQTYKQNASLLLYLTNSLSQTYSKNTLDHHFQDQMAHVPCQFLRSIFQLIVHVNGGCNVQRSLVWLNQVKGIITKDGKKTSETQLSGKWDEQFIVSTKGGAETAVWNKDTTPKPKNRYFLAISQDEPNIACLQFEVQMQGVVECVRNHLTNYCSPTALSICYLLLSFQVNLALQVWDDWSGSPAEQPA